MAKPIDSARLRRWADELDAEEQAELTAAQEEKLAALTAPEHRLDQDEIAWLRKLKEDLAKEDAEDEAKPEDEVKAKRERKPKTEDEKPVEEEKPKRTRPGRKSGAAYSWWVDEDTGKTYKLDVARIYSGPDEADEVALPDEPEEKPEEEAAS